ncbi:MAG TPA: helix-turn-helix domain-containing protein [Geobacteraceae bacterium]
MLTPVIIPSLPIATVAFRTSFQDLSEFNKQFKKAAGIPPSEYRKTS